MSFQITTPIARTNATTTRTIAATIKIYQRLLGTGSGDSVVDGGSSEVVRISFVVSVEGSVDDSDEVSGVVAFVTRVMAAFVVT